MAAYNPFDAKPLLQLLPQKPILLDQPDSLKGPPDSEQKLFPPDRLGQVVEGTPFQRLLSRIHRAKGGHQDDQGGRVVAGQPLDQ